MRYFIFNSDSPNWVRNRWMEEYHRNRKLVKRLISILEVLKWRKKCKEDGVIYWEYLNALYDNGNLKGEK